MIASRILHREFEPPDELRDRIKCFWYDRRELGEVQTSFEVLPDGYVEIVFCFGIVGSTGTDGSLEELPSPFIVGLLNRPLVFWAKGRFEVLGVRCFPWTVFELLGLPPDLGGLRLCEHPIARLQPALSRWIDAGRVEDAVGEVRGYFLNSRSRVATDNTLLKAGMALREANGTLSVSEVAAAAHATVRTLERKFKQSSGYTVKDVSGLMRFEQVRNQLWLYPDSNLSGLAYEMGYADQAHLSREFKRYMGTTPAAFARKIRSRK